MARPGDVERLKRAAQAANELSEVLWEALHAELEARVQRETVADAESASTQRTDELAQRLADTAATLVLLGSADRRGSASPEPALTATAPPAASEARAAAEPRAPARRLAACGAAAPGGPDRERVHAGAGSDRCSVCSFARLGGPCQALAAGARNGPPRSPHAGGAATGRPGRRRTSRRRGGPGGALFRRPFRARPVLCGSAERRATRACDWHRGVSGRWRGCRRAGEACEHRARRHARWKAAERRACRACVGGYGADAHRTVAEGWYRKDNHRS